MDLFPLSSFFLGVAYLNKRTPTGSVVLFIKFVELPVLVLALRESIGVM